VSLLEAAASSSRLFFADDLVLLYPLNRFFNMYLTGVQLCAIKPE